MLFGKYLSWKCPHCGRWQNREMQKYEHVKTILGMHNYINQVQLQCVVCGVSTKLKKSTEYALSVDFKFYNDHVKAIEYVKLKNKESVRG